jgi:hypothetical protein
MAPSFNVIIDKWHPESLVKFKIFLQQSGLPHTKISVTELEFRDVPAVVNPICHFCKKPLVHPYYWLKWEYPVPKDWLAWRDQPAMGCRDCEEAVSFDEKYYKYLKNASNVMAVARTVSSWENLGTCVWDARPAGQRTRPRSCWTCATTARKRR